MHGRRIVAIRGGCRILFEQIETRHEFRASTHRRRAGVNGVVAIRAADRLALGREVTRQIAQLHGVALGVQIVHPLRGHFTFVETIGAVLRDLFQHPREVGILQGVARLQRFAVAKEQRATALVLGKVLTLGRQCGGQSFAYHIPVFCGTNGWCENFSPRHFLAAVPKPRRVHATDGAGHIGKHWAVAGVATVHQQRRVTQACVFRYTTHELYQRRFGERFERDHHFAVPGNTAGIGFYHAECETHRNGRINHVAAFAQNFQTRFSGDGMRAGHGGAAARGFTQCGSRDERVVNDGVERAVGGGGNGARPQRRLDGLPLGSARRGLRVREVQPRRAIPHTIEGGRVSVGTRIAADQPLHAGDIRCDRRSGKRQSIGRVAGRRTPHGTPIAAAIGVAVVSHHGLLERRDGHRLVIGRPRGLTARCGEKIGIATNARHNEHPSAR